MFLGMLKSKISNTFWVLEIPNIFFFFGGGGGGGGGGDEL